MNEIIHEEAGAGRYLGGDKKPISVRTMQRWRISGTGPVWCRLGRLVRYRQSDLDAHLAAHATRSTSEAEDTTRQAPAKSRPPKARPRERKRTRGRRRHDAASTSEAEATEGAAR